MCILTTCDVSKIKNRDDEPSTLFNLQNAVTSEDRRMLSSSNPMYYSKFSGPVYHEYCDCPEIDASVWQSVMQCPAEEPQILADFKTFPTVDLQRLRQEVPQRFSNRGGLIHYAIINNQVYRRTLGKYTDFKMFSDEMLLSLTRKVRLCVLNESLWCLCELCYCASCRVISDYNIICF